MKKGLYTLLLLLIAYFGYSQITEFGKASFYADKFDGRVTASGDIFDQTKLTAAHRTLPFGTVVRVTSMENKSTVVVTVNDRGPFVEDRVIDLSKTAAEKLGFVKKGVVQVKVEVVSLKKSKTTGNNKTVEKKAKKSEPVKSSSPPKQKSSGEVVEYYKLESTPVNAQGFAIQVASYKEAANLMKRCAEIKSQVAKDIIIQVSNTNGSKVYRVMIGTFNTHEAAAEYNKSLRSKFKGSFVKSL